MRQRRAGALMSKDVEQRCDELIAKLGGEIVRFSQPRATKQTVGIADRRYLLARVAFWYEVKRDKEKMRPEQFDFLTHEIERGGIAGTGDVDGLVQMVRAIRRSVNVARRIGEQQILERRAMGFRTKAKAKRKTSPLANLRRQYAAIVEQDPAGHPRAAEALRLVAGAGGARVRLADSRPGDDPSSSGAASSGSDRARDTDGDAIQRGTRRRMSGGSLDREDEAPASRGRSHV